MPVYDYTCNQCGPFEKSVPLAEFEETREVDCPLCGYGAERQFSTPMFSLSWAPRDPYECNPDLDPWRDTALEGAGGPDELNYQSEKIFVDHGTVTQQGGKTVPRKDWLSKMPEGVGT